MNTPSKGKAIETLVPDIYETMEKGASVPEEKIKEFSDSLAKLVSDRLSDRSHRSYLRLSNLGESCRRKLWYSINMPERAEKISGKALLKFLIGDLWEAVLLFLAEVSGHKVEGRQDELDLYGVKGHRDAVIDGVLVDCKSASSYSFQKFKNHLTPEEDAFGYIDQIQGYLHASKDDPLVKDKSRAAFLVGDKTLGTLTLDVHRKTNKDYEKFVEETREMLAQPNPPPRDFHPVKDGESGNMKLPTKCSYCDFKKVCHPKVRTFLYSNGPRYLTTVKRLPNVPEVNSQVFYDDES